MLTIPIEQLLEEQYDILGHGLVENPITEIRVFNGNSIEKVLWCHSKEEFVGQAQSFLDKNIYAGINPRLRESGFKHDIGFLTCMVVDIDPVRPKNTASSDNQHKLACDLASKIASDCRGYYISSGSGAHVYFPCRPVKVENTEGLEKSTKAWMDAIREKYATAELKIDSIFDLPRIIRVWGSLNLKSNRLCGPSGEVGRIDRIDFAFSQKSESKPVKVPDLPILTTRFNALCKSNKRLNDIVSGLASFESPSESDYAFTAIMAEAHFSVEEIESLFPLNPTGNKTPKKGDVARISSKIKTDDKSFSPITGIVKYRQSLANRKMGIRTGLTQLDEMISGLQKQKLYVLPSARPNEGKTSLLAQILDFLATNGEVPLFYPTEVCSEPIIDKIVSRRTGVYLKKFQNGTFLPEDLKKIDEVMPQVQKLPIIIVEDFGLTIEKIEAGLKRYAPSVLAIDFFQAMQFKDPEGVGEKNETVRKLKELAGDYNIPVILASQLNRGDGKLDLKMLKGAGALEEFGDVIAFLYQVDKLTYPCPVEMIIMKSKYSSTGMLKFNFHKSIAKFEEII